MEAQPGCRDMTALVCSTVHSATFNTTMSTPAYPYTPLKTTDIRLVTIDDRGPQLSLKCHTHTASKQPPPVYALSYVWGDSSQVEGILLDVIPFQVINNLYAALESSRANSPAQTYCWIDAICINQTDNEERSQQVQRMVMIYHTAEGVFA